MNQKENQQRNENVKNGEKGPQTRPKRLDIKRSSETKAIKRITVGNSTGIYQKFIGIC